MPRFCLTIALVCLATGCDMPERVSRLEKQNQELQAQLNKQQSTQQAGLDLDLQAKCAKDAKIWFNGNWSRDKDTLLLDYTNHYNKTQNKCFISVQYNRWLDAKNQYVAKSVVLHDIYQNEEYANASELAHLAVENDKPFVTCSIANQKREVKTFQDCFNLIYTSYMTIEYYII